MHGYSRGTRFHVSPVIQFRVTKVAMAEHQLFSHDSCLELFLLFFFCNFTNKNVRSKLISRNAVAHNVIFFNSMICACWNEERERSRTCAVYASKVCRSTRVVAASWPTITELTPTVVLRCLFTCHKQRTV